MSLPYHIGTAGSVACCPTTAFAIVAQTGNMYNGLWYPPRSAGATVVIGGLFIKETKDVDIYANDSVRWRLALARSACAAACSYRPSHGGLFLKEVRICGKLQLDLRCSQPGRLHSEQGWRHLTWGAKRHGAEALHALSACLSCQQVKTDCTGRRHATALAGMPSSSRSAR